MAYRDLTHTFSDLRCKAVFRRKSQTVDERVMHTPFSSTKYAGKKPPKKVYYAKSFFSSPHDVSEHTERLIHPASPRKVEEGKLCPSWVESTKEINLYLMQLQFKLDHLSKLHTRRLMVNFNDAETQNDMEIEQVCEEISNHFRLTERTIKKVTKSGADRMHPPISRAEYNVRLNIQRSMANKLQHLSMKYRKSQNDYIQRLRTLKNSTSAFDVFGDKERSSNVASSEYDLEYQEMIIDAHELIAEERDYEIQRIANSVSHLSLIFKELSTLVIDQGSIIDRIDYNMDDVVSKMKSGVKELYRAEKYQDSSRANRCISFLVVMISLSFVILVMKHASRNYYS